jgi:hypothetical protein
MTALRRLVDNMLDRLYLGTVHVVCPHRHHVRRACSAPACDQYHSLPFSSFAREHYPHRSSIPSTSRLSSAHWHGRSRASTRSHDLAVPTRPASRISHYGDDAGAHAVAYAGLSPDMEGLSRDALQTQEQHPRSLLHWSRGPSGVGHRGLYLFRSRSARGPLSLCPARC